MRARACRAAFDGSRANESFAATTKTSIPAITAIGFLCTREIMASTLSSMRGALTSQRQVPDSVSLPCNTVQSCCHVLDAGRPGFLLRISDFLDPTSDYGPGIKKVFDLSDLRGYEYAMCHDAQVPGLSRSCDRQSTPRARQQLLRPVPKKKVALSVKKRRGDVI